MTRGSLGNFTQSTSIKIVLENSLFLTERKTLDGAWILKRRDGGKMVSSWTGGGNYKRAERKHKNNPALRVKLLLETVIFLPYLWKIASVKAVGVGMFARGEQGKVWMQRSVKQWEGKHSGGAACVLFLQDHKRNRVYACEKAVVKTR